MYSFHELADIVQNEIKNLKYPQQPELLYAPIVYSLEEGGKRIRPVALLMACNLFRDEIDCAKPAALAVEVFHNFTLLHDDIMDRSDTRRGKPAVHTRWNDNVAILSGDAMMIYAYKLLCGCDRRVLPQLLETFNETAIGVCEGQQYDMDFESRDDVTVDRYLEMIRLKTGVLLAGALKLGAICAEAQPWQAELLYNFGINVGLAFQLQDDLFDTYGDAAVFGKPIGGDILAGKKTFLLTTALKTADAATRGELLARLHDGGMSAAEKIETVRGIYDRLGVRKITEKAIADYFRNADRILNSLEVGIERIVPLQELSETLLNRKK
ncbi:polyprenyl synthetase family protein [Alistipes sp. dk3620]|uniref:polyprenyl synthetase family protein n=1 Tax=unclassified Alistipes TaxID=2608932 RepID=UPI0006C04554|nr:MULTISPECIES: polyprenyl synthetase family protein [unclassified Alistipes]MQX26679.1 polyprenyl synthetase family protein [Alistipes sp. dk3620]QGA24077.1 polyprenyl synthetase family protein [Alistipes sp. dk3624]VDR34019.1 Farnesyl diphosphate synthase [Faecalibacterium prausnitzii]HIV59953.1 polyprenyl synthetase family protein [Candidatus Alistipes pullistercoris]